jgi:undecaprenyl-diphosphatase
MHHHPAMIVIPLFVYLLLIAIAWYVLVRILPAVLAMLRRIGRRVAEGITHRGYLERWLSFLPERLLRLKPYGALILIVLAGSGAAYLAGDLFFDLAEELQSESETMLRIDRSVRDWTHNNRYDTLTPFYLTVSIVTNPVGLTILLLAGIAVALLRTRWSLAIYMALTSAIGGLLNRWLKHLFGRERPDLVMALSDAAHESFPSGHAMGSVIVLGALAYGSVRLTSSWNWRSLWVAIAIVSIFAVALSRIYLGVHWISDIAAGFAAGSAWLVTSIVAFESYRQVRDRRRRGIDA